MFKFQRFGVFKHIVYGLALLPIALRTFAPSHNPFRNSSTPDS